MEKSLRVQVPPTTIKKGITFVIPFLMHLRGEGFNLLFAGSAQATLLTNMQTSLYIVTNLAIFFFTGFIVVEYLSYIRKGYI